MAATNRASCSAAAAAENPDIVQQCYDEVESVMQRTLDALATEHPYPILTRLTNLLKRS